MENSRSDKKYSCHIIPYDRGDQKQIKIEDYINIVFYSYPFRIIYFQHQGLGFEIYCSEYP